MLYAQLIDVQITFKEPFGTEVSLRRNTKSGLMLTVLRVGVATSTSLVRLLLDSWDFEAKLRDRNHSRHHTKPCGRSRICLALLTLSKDLLQILTLLTMERPLSFSAEDVRDEKVRVLKAIPSIQPKDVIIGQYAKSLDGSKPGYKEDDTVPKESRCPTFASMVAFVKNERWEGVPFILKAGKGATKPASLRNRV